MFGLDRLIWWSFECTINISELEYFHVNFGTSILTLMLPCGLWHFHMYFGTSMWTSPPLCGLCHFYVDFGTSTWTSPLPCGLLHFMVDFWTFMSQYNGSWLGPTWVVLGLSSWHRAWYRSFCLESQLARLERRLSSLAQTTLCCSCLS